MAGTENLRKPYPEPQFWRFQFKKEIFQWWNWWNQILFVVVRAFKKRTPPSMGKFLEAFPPQWNLRPPVSERDRTRGQQDAANKSQEGMRLRPCLVERWPIWGVTVDFYIKGMEPWWRTPFWWLTLLSFGGDFMLMVGSCAFHAGKSGDVLESLGGLG